MKSNISDSDWKQLQKKGYLNIQAGISDADMYELDGIVNSLVEKYPNGFDVAPLYTGQKSVPRQSELPPKEKYIIPNVGFLEPALLKPLSNPYIYNLIEKIVGKDFYLSNTWFQKMPPGAGRLGYHKDPRGSITINILLDDIDEKMGSTCLIPGSHLNTPPANYSIRHTECEHKDEIDLTGSAGDLAIFTPETWHGRSENSSDKSTRRLFYNFYSRSSKNSTAWHDVVSDTQIEAAKMAIPSSYHHMFHIDRHKTAELQKITGANFRKNIFKASTSNILIKDIAYSASVYGKTNKNENDNDHLMPFTTRLTENSKFNMIKYLSHLRLYPALRELRTVMKNKLSTQRKT